jgi:alpha-1,3-mannosyltransferase
MLEKKAIAGWMRLLEATAQSRCDKWYIGGLLLFELLLCSVILVKVPYTEIDWIAYMEEVEGFENGERDYAQIRGGTGPLVYPAGFLYLFSILKRITHANIRSAQFIFLIFYLIHQWFVLLIYQQVVNGIRKQQQNQGKSKTDPTSSTTHTSAVAIWSWRVAMATTCLSKRIHSIFILRLFNDGPTMLLTYLSIWLFTRQRWNIGCFIFSLAVSIKMNVLLFAPGLLLLLLQANDNLLQVIQTLFFACALPQLVLGAPFLLTYPQSYIRKAFELDRVFFYKWTVNWKVKVNFLLSVLRVWKCCDFVLDLTLVASE